jgi:SAM-dependent methyltransferase
LSHAGPEYWDRYFAELQESGRDLDWEGRWIQPFLEPLTAIGARTILELGCGTGNDAARLAQNGFSVTAVDLSSEAIDRARARFGSEAEFLVADVSAPLPFPNASFDVVMANVALHMFSDTVTRSVFAEIGRVVRPGGLLLFHVNAIEDRPLRARRRPVARELAENYVLEEQGQTMHFFSKAYLEELLEDWREVELEPVAIEDGGEVYKRVWRGVAHR